MIIAIDFDGTLHTGEWPGIGAPAPCAADVMQALKDKGHYLIVWTCREGDAQRDAVNWLLENNIPFDRVNDNNPAQTEIHNANSRKISAHLYIDDKQVGGLPSWPDILDYVEKLEADYKQLQHGKEST
ncbi:HAD family hydrolase [Dysgonomonas termitidis]|uniref:Hydrolase n=1 Tax=Dysgonomonas termitidis TaxID=1516126 RepID=A0ABV9KU61_9BACT